MFVHKFEQLLKTNERALEIFKWAGNAASYIAAIVISISIVAAQSSWPFALYILANLIWIKAALIMEDRPLFWMQAFFIVINSYAIWLRA